MASASDEGSVNIYEAKSNFSRLVTRVEHGERIVISRSGRPVARLIPYEAERATRQPGAWRGRLRIADDFDEFTAADDAAWHGMA